MRQTHPPAQTDTGLPHSIHAAAKEPGHVGAQQPPCEWPDRLTADAAARADGNERTAHSPILEVPASTEHLRRTGPRPIAQRGRWRGRVKLFGRVREAHFRSHRECSDWIADVVYQRQMAVQLRDSILEMLRHAEVNWACERPIVLAALEEALQTCIAKREATHG